MGTILQERVPQRSVEREWRKKASWSSSRPNVASNKMGRRQSQRKSLQPQYTFPGQDNHHDKRLQQRRKHKPNTSSTKNIPCQHSAQGTSESKSHPLCPAQGRMESKVQPAAQRSGHGDKKHTCFRESRQAPTFSCHRLSDSSPDLLERHTPNLEVGSLSTGEGDSDTDLSESERLPGSLSGHVLPQLELRPEVIVDEDCPTQRHRPRGQGCAGFDFPDFLPPPFNSWCLRQLAIFYNVEGRGAPQPRPVGSLERYLERLLQLEWHQIQTVQEESWKSAVSDVTHSCCRSPAASSFRLSSPKCILQCQRAFPLTFLSSLVSHSALLCSCACTLCYSTCSTSCCRSTHSHPRQSRISPILERRGPVSLPKRSFSESRVYSSDRSPASQTHLRRMQASGNIRNPVQGANAKPQSTAGDCMGAWGNVLDYRAGGVRNRSGSEQRRSGVERQQNGAEKKRSGSECRRRGIERRRAADFKEIKPDAVTAIMDNLPASKYSPVNRLNRQKQVEFVT